MKMITEIPLKTLLAAALLFSAAPKLLESDDGYPSSEKLAHPSRGTPITSYMTPREHPSFAGTTIM